MKKIYTCTPVSFEANEHFHIRDTGLIAKTLRSLGVESKCIMPLPHHPGDLDLPLIRTELKNLSDPNWWKSLNIDALVLYSWGAPKYTPVARAVHKAGIKLLIHMDFNGRLKSPPHSTFIKKAKNVLLNIIRRIHLGYADYITTSLVAQNAFRKSLYYGNKIADKIQIMPAPIAPHFQHIPQNKKECKVVCIGRWSDDAADNVKRPEYLIQVAKHVTQQHQNVIIEIYGRLGSKMIQMHENIPEEQRKRVHLMGYANNADLCKIYNSAQISICPSYSESTHIASCEALCCGCSVVVPPTERHQVLQWYTTHNSGTLSQEDTPESMAKAIHQELILWEQGQRAPQEIASFWQDIFHVDKAMKRIFNL